MKRLIEKIVFSGLVIAWRRATCPTNRSPDFDTWVAVFRPALSRKHRQLTARTSLYSRRLSERDAGWLHRLLVAVTRAQTPSEHNAGLNFWTRANGPWRLVYFESFETKEAALLQRWPL